MESTGAQSSNELQRLDYMTGYQECSLTYRLPSDKTSYWRKHILALSILIPISTQVLTFKKIFHVMINFNPWYNVTNPWYHVTILHNLFLMPFQNKDLLSTDPLRLHLLIKINTLGPEKNGWDLENNIFKYKQFGYFDWNFTDVCSWCLFDKKISIGSGNDSAPSRGQATAWTNDEPAHWHIYTWSSPNVLTHGPSDFTWWHTSGNRLASVMACCLMAPSHYLK